MSNNLEPKKVDRIEKPIEPDLKKGSGSMTAPSKPQAPPQPKPKKS